MLSMSPSKRRDTDMMKLMMSDFEVHIPDESSMHDFLVAFPGPEDTPYTGGIWKVHVTLPKEYPFKSPSIGFENRMFHPNVDEMSGSVCLDVINQTWSPMFDLVNIFKLFIPQLLSYPNPTDPLNGEAAALLMRDPEAYAGRIRDCVRLYASDPVHLDGSPVIVAAATSNPNNPAANDPNTNNPAANNPTANNPNTNNPNTSNPNTNNASASSSSGGGGSSSSSDGVSAGANASASAIASAIGIGGGGGGSSGGRSNSIGSDTSGMSGMSGMSGISASSDESESSSEDNKPSAADGANADARGGGDNRRENDCEGGEDTTMGEGGGKAGNVKRRDSTAGNNNGGGENSCRSSSSSEFMMEMDMDETASDVSALSDVDG